MTKYFFIATVVVLLAGCRQRASERQLLIMNQGFENCNGLIQDNIELLHTVMEQRLRDPLSHDYAVIWEPRFIRIQKQADSIRLYIDSLKGQVVKQSDSLKLSNAAVVKALYESGGTGIELLKRLIVFKKGVAVFIREEIVKDKYINYDFGDGEIESICKRVPLLPGYADSLNEEQRAGYAKKWVEDNFAGSTATAAVGVLNKIKNDLLVTTKEFLAYCIGNATFKGCNHGYKPFMLATISSSYVKRGQQIDVLAGIGELQLMGNPRIIINGKEIALKESTTASYRFKASGKPGKHYVTVKFKYSRHDGETMDIYKKLEYIIAEEK